MVDVSSKAASERVAIASAVLRMQPSTLRLILDNAAPKGDVFAVARVAGIMAAKRTSDLIPLCHPLPLSTVGIEFEPNGDERIRITATAKVTGQTGVEMEALTAASIAALTIYDMVKAVDRAMVIEAVRLDHKSGGKSGRFDRGAK